MAVITTGNNPKLLWPGLNAIWGRDYEEYAKEYTDLFSTETSDMNYEEEVEMTGFGLAPVKPQGQATVYDTDTQGTVNRYTHVAYGLGFVVTREERDDNLYEKKAIERTQQLAFSFRQTRENIGANIYNRAFNSAYTYGDGQPLLSTAHPTLSGNQSNTLAVAADLSEASLEDMSIQVGQAANSRGLRIALIPRKLILPINLQFEGARILKSALQNDTANNAINALKSMGAFPDGTAINHYLTDPDAWFTRTNAPRGMTWFDRVKTEFAEDGDFDTGNWKYKGYMRFSAGASDFRGLFGSPGA